MGPVGMCSFFLPAMLAAHKAHPKKIPQGLKLFIRARKRARFQNHEEVGLDIRLPLDFLATD